MTWLADGTFKECPSIFYQLFTIHVECQGYCPVCVYLLLPNKQEKTYLRVFEVIKQYLVAIPSRSLVDSEIALLNAFKKTFEEVTKSGCYVHFCKDFIKLIEDVRLNKEYENNSELDLALKLVPTLAFFTTC